MTRQNAIVAPLRLKDVDLNPDVIGQEKIPDVYGPFVSHGTISLVGSVEERPSYNIKRYGASQSLVLESVLSFSDKSETGLKCCCRVWN